MKTKSSFIYILAIFAGLNIGTAASDVFAGIGASLALYIVIFIGDNIIIAIKEQKR